MLLPVNAAMMDACVLVTLDKEDTYGYRITQQLSQGLGVSEFLALPRAPAAAKGWVPDDL